MGKPVKKTLKKGKKEEKPAEEAKVLEKKEEGKKDAPKKDAPKKDASKKDAPKKDAPKTEKKDAKPEVSPEEKAKLTKEAIAEILKGIAEPDAQKAGTAFIPPTWHTKYKTALGAYKKFVQSHPDTLQVIEMERGNFVVIKPGDKPPATSVTIVGNWKKLLHKAWNAFVAATPQAEQTKENFLQAISVKLGGPPPAPKGSASATASPKLAPAAPTASPKVAPADKGGDKGTKKDGKVLKKKKKA